MKLSILLKKEMKILIEKPPVFDKVKELYGISEADMMQTLFAWGDAIYNPGDIRVDKYLMVHEAAHSFYQEEKGGADVWWDLYLLDVDYRADQEAKAYGFQYMAYCEDCGDRNKRSWYLDEISKHLSSDLYNLGITKAEAKKAILNRHFDRKL